MGPSLTGSAPPRQVMTARQHLLSENLGAALPPPLDAPLQGVNGEGKHALKRVMVRRRVLRLLRRE